MGAPPRFPLFGRMQADTEESFRLLTEMSPDAIILIDPAGVIQAANDSAADLYGLDSVDEAIGLHILDLTALEDHARLMEDFASCVQTGRARHRTYRVRQVNGTLVPVEASGSAVYDECGNIHAVLAIVRDISSRYAAEEARRDFEAVVQSSSDIIVETDAGGRVRTWNPAAEKLIGRPAAEVLGQDMRDLLPPDRREAFHHAFLRVLDGHDIHSHHDSMLRADGARLPVSVSMSRVESARGVTGVVLTAQDLTDQVLLYEGLQRFAHHDQLTGLPNRLLLQQYLEDGIGEAREKGMPVAAVLLRLTSLRQVNAALGHEIGDLVIQEAAQRLVTTVGVSGMVARLDTREFAIVLPGMDIDGAMRVIQEIRAALLRPVSARGHAIAVESIQGVAAFPEDGSDAATLLRHAGVALDTARRGGLRYAEYTAESDPRPEMDLSLGTDLQRAIAEGQLVLHYQPIVELGSGWVRKVEALVRWRHPERGLIGPAEFIPLAEEWGLVEDLALWVLQEAVRAAAAWRRQGLDLQVAVNLAPQNLHDPDLSSYIRDLLLEHDLPGSSLALEVTETTLMVNRARVQETLERFREWGIEVAIDDFGTGYSSLAYLQQLPVQAVKIDRSFMQGEVKGGMTIVQGVVEIGHNLGLHVTAEGVETQDALDWLARLGCDAVQGYYFSRPLPPEELAGWIRRSEGRAGSSPAHERTD